ncbi:MAG: ABC transporter ATP-binding protein [Rhodothalassiaceae bacterium]
MYVSIENVSKNYRKGGKAVVALDGVSLAIEKGEFVALMGPSGSGKTTLLNLIAGLDRPDAGTIRIDGREQALGSDSERSHWRAETVGIVFQNSNLVQFLSALRNVELPLLLKPMSSADRRRRARTLLALVDLADRESHYPRELSGGQEQRVAIARALAADPKILLCDEPTGDLDRDSADTVLRLLRTLSDEFGRTVIMVTHDPAAAAVADRRIAFMKGGRLVRTPDGTSDETGGRCDPLIC